jgi:hypothetical protein
MLVRVVCLLAIESENFVISHPDSQPIGDGALGQRRAACSRSRCWENHKSLPAASSLHGVDVLEWESGSIDAILAGGVATPVQAKPSDTAAVDRFALARQVVSLKAAFAKHLDGMAADTRQALTAEVTSSAREAEESIITLMPWLDDTERGQAIELLVALREPIGAR